MHYILSLAMKMLGTKKIRNMLLDLANELANRTDNTFDDSMVELIESLLNKNVD